MYQTSLGVLQKSEQAEKAVPSDVDAAWQGRPCAATAPSDTSGLAIAVDGVQAPSGRAGTR